MKSWKLKLLVIFIGVLAIAGSAYAQTDASTGASHLDALRSALAAEQYLDAYNEVFMLYDSAPADLIETLASKPATEADQQVQIFVSLFSGHVDQALTEVGTLPVSTFYHAAAAAANDLLGNTADATSAFELALAGSSDAAQLNGLMAAAGFVTFNVDQILQYSSRAIELDPSLASAYRLRGVGSLFSGDPEEALIDADRAIELDPSIYFFHFLKANAHFALGDPAAALNDLSAVLALEPNSVIGSAMLSRANTALGHTEQAALDFARSVEVRTIDTVEIDRLLSDVPVQVTMTFGRTFRLPLEAQAGQTLTVHATSVNPGEVDPVVMVLSPEGIPVVDNDDASDENLDAVISDYPITQSGIFTVVVSHANGGSEGDLEILASLH